MSSYANHVLFSSKVWIGHKLNEVSNTIVNVESSTWTDERIEQEWHGSLMLKFFHWRLLLFFSLLSFILLFPQLPNTVMTPETTPVTVPAGQTSILSWPQWLTTPKKIMGFTIFLLVKLPTKYTRLRSVEETLRPANAVVVSVGQVLTYWKLCPNQKEAIIWPNICSLRYSNRSIFNAMEASPLFAFYNTGDVSDVEAFNNVLLPLLNRLRNRTASGNSTHKFAAQSASAPNFQTIYALLECTPDLSKLDCNSCLEQHQSYIPQCCNGKQGGRFVSPSCEIGFEVYSFYDPSVEPPPSPPPPSPSPPPQVPSAASPPPESPTITPGI